jgi:hypothetical protein
MTNPMDDIETIFDTNPFFEKGWNANKANPNRKNTDEIVYMLAAIAFELNQMRRRGLFADVRTFDGDR